MDLVDEEDVALLERGEDGGEVAGPLDGRPTRVADVHSELAGDDRRESRLAEAGRAVEEDVIGRLFPPPRRSEEIGEVGLDLTLADVLGERMRPEGAFDGEVGLVDEARREDPRDVVGHRPESTMSGGHFARMFDTLTEPRSVRPIAPVSRGRGSGGRP